MGRTLHGPEHVKFQNPRVRYVTCEFCGKYPLLHYVEGKPSGYDYSVELCFECTGGKHTKQSFSDWLREQEFEDKFLNNRLPRVIAEAMSILNSKTTLGIQALVKICIGYMELPPVYQNCNPVWRENPPKLLVDNTERVTIGPKSRVAHKSLTIVLPPELAELCLEYLAGEPGFSFPLQL